MKKVVNNNRILENISIDEVDWDKIYIRGSLDGKNEFYKLQNISGGEFQWVALHNSRQYAGTRYNNLKEAIKPYCGESIITVYEFNNLYDLGAWLNTLNIN